MNLTQSNPTTLGEWIRQRQFHFRPVDFRPHEDHSCEETCMKLFSATFHEHDDEQRPLLLSYLIILRIIHNTKIREALLKEDIDLLIEPLTLFTEAFCNEHGHVKNPTDYNPKGKEELDKKFKDFWNILFYKFRIGNVPEIVDCAVVDLKLILTTWKKQKPQMDMLFNASSTEIIMTSVDRIIKGHADWKKIRQQVA